MPFFKPKYQLDGDGYLDSGVSAETLQTNLPHALSYKDHDLLIIKLDDSSIMAISSACPHAAADLADGYCHRGRITCPEHDWKFDLKSGRTLYPEDEHLRLKRYETKLDKTIKIKIDPSR